MAEIARYIPAPYGGVSQAPPLARQPEQAEALENCLVAIPQGVTKRPPFTGQCILQDHPGDTNGLFEHIQRLVGLDVFLTVTNEAGVVVPRVYAMGGLPQAYNATGYAPEVITIDAAAQTYLNTGNPDPTSDLAVLTVEDYTFILNRKVTVDVKNTAGVPDINTVRSPEAMLWVRLSAYGRTYTVTVTPAGGTPVSVTLKTPTGATTADADWVDTDRIAGALISGTYTAIDGASISGNLSGLSSQGFTVTRIGGVISLVRASGGDFTVLVEDGQGGTALTAVKGSVQHFSDLPAKAVNGFTVKIAQQASTSDDDFYVQFIETAGTGTGIWQEVLAPGAQLGLDPNTMPVGLFYDGGWKLQVLPWKSRTTGNELLALDPDFIGQGIEDLTFAHGRLGVVSGEGVTLSASDDPYRFYPRTLSSVLDSDPVSLVSPYPGKSTLRYAIPFDTRTIVFGDVAQLQIYAEGIFAPKSGRIDPLTSYEFSRKARPQASNGKVYFLAPHGFGYSTVYEMSTDKLSATTAADDLSDDVPRYVPEGVDRVANCPVNYTIVYGQSGSSKLYPHLFRYRNRERIQNAFQEWDLPVGHTLGGMFFVNTQLWAMVCKDGYAGVVVADFAPDILDPAASSRLLTRLDFRIDETQVQLTYEGASARTRVVLPYARTADLRVSVRAPGGQGGLPFSGTDLPDYPEGFLVTPLADQTAAGANEVLLPGDWTACPLFFGYAYTARYRPTRFYALAQDGTPLRSGRLGVRSLTIDLSETGYLKVTVTAQGRLPRSYTFEGQRYDDPLSAYGQVGLATTAFRVPVMTESDQLTIDILNDSHLPSQVLGFEWRGEFNPKAQRL
jgi:hypothetical protein